MVISRTAPVECPHCHHTVSVLWNESYSVPYSIACDECTWFVDLLTLSPFRRRTSGLPSPCDRRSVARMLRPKVLRLLMDARRHPLPGPRTATELAGN